LNVVGGDFALESVELRRVCCAAGAEDLVADAEVLKLQADAVGVCGVAGAVGKGREGYVLLVGR